MSLKFHAEADPSRASCEKVLALAPANPFYTFGYVELRRSLGFQPWVLALRQDERLISACTAFMKRTPLGRSLEITSLPWLPDGDIFWAGLSRFCRRTGVTFLDVNSAASPKAEIPALAGETRRRVRSEFILNLQRPDPWKALASNHLRNIKRARKAGVKVERAGGAQACREHAGLLTASMARRKMRGESVPEKIETQSFLPYVQKGTAEFFRALLDGKVLSSILVQLSERGGYYQSAGTGAEGMDCGASHLLVYEIANLLRRESKEVFNLGGVEPSNAGLRRFKAGFGAEEVRLEAASFMLCGAMRRRFITSVRSVRHRFAGPLQRVLGYSSGSR